jgi:hypothetical protein
MKKDIEQLKQKAIGEFNRLFNSKGIDHIDFDGHIRAELQSFFLSKLSELEQAVRKGIRQKINEIELTLSEEDKKKLEGESVEFGMGYGQTWLLNKINKLFELEPDRDCEAEGYGEYEAQQQAEAEWEAQKAAEAQAEWEQGQCIPDEEPPF